MSISTSLLIDSTDRFTPGAQHLADGRVLGHVSNASLGGSWGIQTDDSSLLRSLASALNEAADMADTLAALAGGVVA